MGVPTRPRKCTRAPGPRSFVRIGKWCIVRPLQGNNLGITNMNMTMSEMDSDEVLRVKLEVLRREHRDLDEAIAALGERAHDSLTLMRLKKQKLVLKDRIARIEDQITPDIIA